MHRLLIEDIPAQLLQAGGSQKQLVKGAQARLNEFSDKLRNTPSVNLSAQVSNLTITHTTDCIHCEPLTAQLLCSLLGDLRFKGWLSAGLPGVLFAAAIPAGAVACQCFLSISFAWQQHSVTAALHTSPCAVPEPRGGGHCVCGRGLGFQHHLPGGGLVKEWDWQDGHCSSVPGKLAGCDGCRLLGVHSVASWCCPYCARTACNLGVHHLQPCPDLCVCTGCTGRCCPHVPFKPWCSIQTPLVMMAQSC
jgi:hypothetical protein